MDCSELFSKQLDSWADARLRYEDLKRVERKDFDYDGAPLAVQFNPARMVSTAAKIDTKALAARPCFLCEKNRPKEQMIMPIEGRYQLLVNPFPILPVHFTIPSAEHKRQEILPHYEDMVKIAEQMSEYFVFYNGPKSGASAPDHMHFQAGSRGIVPLERDWKEVYKDKITPITGQNGVYELNGFVCRAVVIIAHSASESVSLFEKVYEGMNVPEGEYEPRMNILSWKEPDDSGECVTIIIPRGKHRPDCYYAEGDEQMLVSPGALDMAGLIITPRQVDFERLTPELVNSILKECQ